MEDGVKEVKDSFIKIKTKVSRSTYDGRTYFVAEVTDPKQLNCRAQGDTEEEANDKLFQMVKFAVSFYIGECKNYSRRAIFRSNKNWFTIVGLGFNLVRSKDSKFIPKVITGIGNFGITESGSLRMGKTQLYFINEWRRSKQ